MSRFEWRVHGEPAPGLWRAAGMDVGGTDDGLPDDRLRLSDLGKLARRTRRRVVRAARADDRPTFTKLLAAHLGQLDGLEVVEESWPSYEHVNVQVGLDVWLQCEGLDHELIGMAGFRHRDFGLTDLLRPGDHEDYGPVPGHVAWTQLPCGPDGEVRPAVRAGLYLVDDGTRSAVMVVAGDVETGMSGLRVHVFSPPTRRPGGRSWSAPHSSMPRSTSCSTPVTP